MARTAATLPNGARVTDFISLGVITHAFPLGKIHEVLRRTSRASRRQRALPAHVVVYYVIALALFMQVAYTEVLRALVEGLRWLRFPRCAIPVAGKSAISRARSRLGVEPVRELHDELVRPIAQPGTRGAWYRRWRLVSLDGSTLDVADTKANARAFGRPGASRGRSAFPQLRFVSLVENGTHVLFASAHGASFVTEAALAQEVLPHLKPGMLCLADRYFFGWRLWQKATATGAALVWRLKRNARLGRIEPLPDGSYLAAIYPSAKDRRHNTRGVRVRAIDYTLEGVAGAEPVCRLITTILDPAAAPAAELAALYHERWEIETAFDELKTHLRGARLVLRSKTPQLVVQEFYGLMMAHFAVRGLMHEAALKADLDPDRLSFVHSVRVIRRKLPIFHAISPSGSDAIPPSGSGRDPRGTSRLQPRPAKQARR